MNLKLSGKDGSHFELLLMHFPISCTEEEMKRLYESMGEGYAAVAFNYEEPQMVVQPQTKVEGLCLYTGNIIK